MLTPQDRKDPYSNLTCTINDVLAESVNCIDMFVMDVIQTHMNTTDQHIHENSNTYHIPALFGDDFAYTNASHNFLFINKLSEIL